MLAGVTELREAAVSFGLIDSLVAVCDLALRPGDQRNVIQSYDLLPHLAHHGEKRRWFHEKIVAHLPVGSSRGECAQDDGFFVGQGRVQVEACGTVDADQVVIAFHRFSTPLWSSAASSGRCCGSCFAFFAAGTRAAVLIEYKAVSAAPNRASIVWPSWG